MAKRDGFWTWKKLKELHALYQSVSMPHLEKHFERHRDDIQTAYEFYKMHKKLKKKHTTKRGVTYTLYKPIRAEGASPSLRYYNEDFYA